MKKLKRYGVILIILTFIGWLLYLHLLVQYSHYCNNQALTIIKNVNPDSYTIFNDFIKNVESKTDWKVIIISGYRDEAKQAILKKQNPKNASPGKSKHNFAKAIDINLYRKRGFFYAMAIQK
jgi:hypothetical protein